MTPSSSFSNDLRCPDDGHLLQTNEHSPVPFASCRHCDGLWFTHDAIEKGGKPTLPPAARSALPNPAPTPKRACPHCSERLNAETVNDHVIDICPSCGGVWLDPGEYTAARLRNVKMRFERELPSLRPASSPLGLLMDRIFQLLDENFILEEEPKEFEPRGLIPRKRSR